MADEANFKKRVCPICKTETPWSENPFRPFCSERCKVIDLGGWASEQYRLEEKMKNPEENDR
jgi:uncharacterized protein